MKLAWLLVLTTGCGIRYWVCDEVPASTLQKLPSRLSETSLFTDTRMQETADGVVAYRPEFELWSDGAQKRRWISLPAGTQVDTSDMEAWSFPTGTKLWKEFTRGGVRVETRLLAKFGPRDEDWVAAAYVWQADQADAVLTPAGQANALGTPHDVPAAKECAACHGGRKSRVLGFAAVQLSESATELAPLLSGAPPSSLASEQREAFGYLYANCAHCHNTTRPAQTGARCYDPRNTLDLSRPASVEDKDALVSRMQRRSFGGMPPLASEQVDTAGINTVRGWIAHPF